MTTTAAAASVRRHTETYPAEPEQVRQARAALAGWLRGFPWADEAILIASEFAANSVLYSASRDGGAFTLRAEISPRTPEARGATGRATTAARTASMS